MVSADRARGRSVYCAPEVQAAMRERAREAGVALSRLVIDRAHADDPDRHRLVLSEPEQGAMRDDLAECAALARALDRGLPGCGSLGLFEALELLAGQWRG